MSQMYIVARQAVQALFCHAEELGLTPHMDIMWESIPGVLLQEYRVKPDMSLTHPQAPMCIIKVLLQQKQTLKIESAGQIVTTDG